MKRVGAFNGIGTLVVVLTDGALVNYWVKAEPVITLAGYRLEQ
jgi:hypothetical protein